MAGYNYGETTEAFASSFRVDRAKLPPGKYRNITGNEALAWGLMTAAQLSGKELFLGSYPITPASDILHELSKYKNFGVRTFQAEDEIAGDRARRSARRSAGTMAVTATSGPGIALKGEGDGPGGDARTAADRSSTCSAAGRAPACRPRPSRPTCCRRCSAATANARCRSSPPAARPIASTSRRKPGGSRRGT